MANTNKTKAEILQELESIKGLLLEEDDIPILQALEGEDEIIDTDFHPQTPTQHTQHEPILPGQGSLFEQAKPLPNTTADHVTHNKTSAPDPSKK